mmetsp:Transcript_31110/g.75630  ORF Transcript_31110/g.75630 Transcript_31110/m.75630 type:complete len:90 (+) Transcript_31110:406-675(+)
MECKWTVRIAGISRRLMSRAQSCAQRIGQEGVIVSSFAGTRTRSSDALSGTPAGLWLLAFLRISTLKRTSAGPERNAPQLKTTVTLLNT